MFEGSFSSFLQFVEQNLPSKTEYSELGTISQTCALLNGLLSLTTAEHTRYERLYVFAFLWSFGVLLPVDAQAKLEEFIRNHDKIVLDLPPVVAGTSMFDYLVDNHGT